MKATSALAEKDGFVGPCWQAQRQVEKGHGRLEIREQWTLSDPEILKYLDPDGKMARLARHWDGAGRAAHGATGGQRDALLLVKLFVGQDLCHGSQKPLGD